MAEPIKWVIPSCALFEDHRARTKKIFPNVKFLTPLQACLTIDFERMLVGQARLTMDFERMLVGQARLTMDFQIMLVGQACKENQRSWLYH